MVDKLIRFITKVWRAITAHDFEKTNEDGPWCTLGEDTLCGQAQIKWAGISKRLTQYIFVMHISDEPA
jgi:hypothetical protein